MVTQSLPVELVDMILGHLRPESLDSPAYHGMKKAMRACSLVCQDWHEIVRPHLFHHITYSFVSIVPEDILERPMTVNCHSLSKLRQLLRMYPEPAHCIRKLRLRQLPRAKYGLPTDSPYLEEAKIEYDDLLSLLRATPNLQELYLIGILVERSWYTKYPDIPRSLDRVHITYNSLDSPDIELPTTIGCATQINTLVLSGLSVFTLKDENGPLIQPRCPAVECLVLDRASGDEVREQSLFQVLDVSLRLDTVRALTIEDARWIEYTELLMNVGPQLEKLQLFISGLGGSFVGSDSDELEDEDDDGSAVRHCTNLRELVLVFFFDDVDDTDCVGAQLQPLADFVQLLEIAQKRYPQLAEFTLQVDLPLDWDSSDAGECVPTAPILEPEDVNEQLDALLVAIVENTSVASIRIQWAPSQTYIGPECEASIRSMFPMLSGNDLLTFPPPSEWTTW